MLWSLALSEFNNLPCPQCFASLWTLIKCLSMLTINHFFFLTLLMITEQWCHTLHNGLQSIHEHIQSQQFWPPLLEFHYIWDGRQTLQLPIVMAYVTFVFPSYLYISKLGDRRAAFDCPRSIIISQSIWKALSKDFSLNCWETGLFSIQECMIGITWNSLI